MFVVLFPTLFPKTLALVAGCGDAGPSGGTCAELCAMYAPCGPAPSEGLCGPDPSDPEAECLEACGDALQALSPAQQEELSGCRTCVDATTGGTCDAIDRSVALYNTCSQECVSDPVVELLDELAFGWGTLEAPTICQQRIERLRACCVSVGGATESASLSCDSVEDQCVAGCVLDAPCGALSGSDAQATEAYATCVSACASASGR
ncbi:MAG TPA: hypothetical protein ENK18_21595 [Deltaproteobacteria bacterium]|nr:hypothetical protein [Deltaproteobacteria bacterium]